MAIKVKVVINIQIEAAWEIHLFFLYFQRKLVVCCHSSTSSARAARRCLAVTSWGSLKHVRQTAMYLSVPPITSTYRKEKVVRNRLVIVS